MNKVNDSSFTMPEHCYIYTNSRTSDIKKNKPDKMKF